MGAANLLNTEDEVRLEKVLKYIEDADLRRWSLPEIKAFTIGLSEWRSKLNCITNPYMYEQVHCSEIGPFPLIFLGLWFVR